MRRRGRASSRRPPQPADVWCTAVVVFSGEQLVALSSDEIRRLRRACDRLQNLHQDVRLARIPDQFEVLGTVSVRNNKSLKGVALENQEFDLPLSHTVRNGVLNALAAELASVDA